MIPMIYKSEAGTIVDRINRDVGVANEIFMENEPKQTGYNTVTCREKGKLHACARTHTRAPS